MAIFAVWIFFPTTSIAGNFRGLSGMQISTEMAPGVNLSNTLDAYCTYVDIERTETCWGRPMTKKELIAGIAQRGFKTLRIPTTWFQHTGPAPDYSIDTYWMDRVQELVDYALSYNLYVILNLHHEDLKPSNPDGRWLRTTYADSSTNSLRIKKLWEQIGSRFKDYGDYLIFETLNEPRAVDTPEEWNGGTAEHRAVVNHYNKVALSAIRNSGGNNHQRFVMMPQVAAALKPTVESLSLPNDPNVIVSVHVYYPYFFALNNNDFNYWGTAQHRADLVSELERLRDTFIAKGQAVVIGEWGVTNEKDNTQRIDYYDLYTKTCTQFQLTPIAWMFEYDRWTKTWTLPELEESILKYYYQIPTTINLLLPKDTIRVGESLQLSANVQPSSIIPNYTIWATKDERIASINQNGLITGHKQGVATVSVGINGKIAEKEIFVIDDAAKSIRIEAEDFLEQNGLTLEFTADVDGVENLKNVNHGEWSTYRVFIPKAGYYNLTARIATPGGKGGEITFTEGNSQLGVIDANGVGSSGWQDWITTAPTEVFLSAGIHELKFTYNSTITWGLYNINWFNLEFDRPELTVGNTLLSKAFLLHPNPVKEVLYFGSAQQFTLFDLSGKEIANGVADSINFSAFSKGTYFLKLSDNSIKKIIKE